MYIILDNQLNRVGTLSNQNANGTPFYNDSITQQIADDDQTMNIQSVPDTTNAYDPNGNSKNWGHTLDSIYIPYGYPDTKNIAEGNSLAYQDPNNGHWYVMRLTSVTDAEDNSGNHYKEASGVNLCIWKLGKTVHYAETIKNASSRKAFSALLDDTGWYYDPTSELVGGSSDIQFDGTSSSQALLQQLCQTYGAEIDAYVLFPQDMKYNGHYYASDFRVAMKMIKIKRHLGEDKGDRVVYGRNATNIQRTVVDDSLYTRLYVYGANGATCACEATNQMPYVEDETANQIYNPALGDNAENYLEGAITSQTMKNPERLAQWGLKQLKIFNHPRANYTVNVSNTMNTGMGNKAVMDSNLGDTYRVIDYKMDPPLTVEARVIRKQLSFANPYSNNITLGEYTTVNVVPPAFIDDLQQGEFNRINQILEEIKNDPGALSCTIDKPDGTTWHYNEPQKKFIAHIYVLGEDITDKIQPQGYVWELRQQGQLNEAFREQHSEDGNTLVLKNDIKLNSDAEQDMDQHMASENAAINSAASSTSSDADSPASLSFSSGISFNADDLSDRMGEDPGETDTDIPGDTKDDPSKDPSKSDDDDTPGGDDSFDINGELAGPETVTGEVRLLIDTDYISDQLKVDFNTRRINHLFTVSDWIDVNGRTGDEYGDHRIGAIQYANYNPNEKLYYVSSVYYGRYRPRKEDGSFPSGTRGSHTRISRLDKDGHYKDSMIMLYSHHNSNFGLDYSTPGGPYIWTTFQDNYDMKKYYLARINYQPNTISIPQDLAGSQKILSYSEPACMTYYDNSSDMVLFSHDDTNTNPTHPVDFYHAKDLLAQGNNAQPFKTIHLTDYGLDPKIETYSLGNNTGNGTHNPDNDSSQNTFQSGCLRYPYYIFDSGNMNMSDQRMVWCIDLSKDQKVFAKPLDMNEFDLNEPNKVIGKNPGDYVFAEPETINWATGDNGDPVFLFGVNVGYENNRNNGYKFTDEGIPTPDYKHYELLYQVGMDINNDKTNDDNGDHSNNGHPDINK